MTQYNSLNVKLSNSQLNKKWNWNSFNIIIKYDRWWWISEWWFYPHKLLLTNRQVTNLCKASADKSSTDIKLSKTQKSKMIQSGGFLGRLLGPFLKTGLPLMKNVIKPSAKSVLIPLGLSAAASAADAGVHKKALGSGKHPSESDSYNNTILII